MISRRDIFIKENLKQPFLAVHLRNGLDWKRACEHVDPIKGLNYPFMSSPQCTGYGTHKIFTHSMCLPDHEDIKKEVLRISKMNYFASIFIATDSNPMIEEFRNLFVSNNLNIDIVEVPQRLVELDLAVMIEANVFIGNC